MIYDHQRYGAQRTGLDCHQFAFQTVVTCSQLLGTCLGLDVMHKPSVFGFGNAISETVTVTSLPGSHIVLAFG